MEQGTLGPVKQNSLAASPRFGLSKGLDYECLAVITRSAVPSLHEEYVAGDSGLQPFGEKRMVPPDDIHILLH
ncbi:hypothetical protein HPB51_014113 [Rhipicephalus microplus]|uniref:Uncharacterized protein n=1 Tax=Rhipicephalus microplus TaxID=6941 RepID=A0A9J6DVB8_RHIMP|nr:hypothetical protein HPB51_014113 [Rhipicephalus microplus]